MDHILKYGDFISEILESSELSAVHAEGLKYYPKLRYFETTLRNDPTPSTRFFTNYPKNKGSYSIHQFKAHIVHVKIDLIMKWLAGRYKLTNVVRSMTTSSVYFNINGTSIRISDHDSTRFDGSKFTLTWKDDPSIVFDSIKQLIDNESHNSVRQLPS